MDITNKIVVAISILFIWLPLGFPSVHKILRNKKIYNSFLFLSILLPIISFATWYNGINNNQKSSSFMTFCPILFLILYKFFDNIILKKYNRHIYFYRRYNIICKDVESDYAKSIDRWFQFLVIIIPMISCGVASWIILKILPKYYC